MNMSFEIFSFASGLVCGVPFVPFALKQISWINRKKKYQKNGYVAIEVLEKSGLRTRTYIKPKSPFIRIEGYSGKYLIGNNRYIMDKTLGMPVHRYVQDNAHEIDFLKKTVTIDFDSEENKDIRKLKDIIFKLETELGIKIKAKQDLEKALSNSEYVDIKKNIALFDTQLKVLSEQSEDRKLKRNKEAMEEIENKMKELIEMKLEQVKGLEPYYKLETEIENTEIQIKQLKDLKDEYSEKLKYEVEEYRELKDDVEHAVETLIDPQSLELLTIQERKKLFGSANVDLKKALIIIGALVVVGGTYFMTTGM